MKLYHAHIYPMDREPIENGWVSIQDGKITELGQGEIVPGPEDRDLAGGMLLPGFVDAHTHLGIIENGIGFEGDDCNEASDPFTPQLRAIDGINPWIDALQRHGVGASPLCSALRAVPTPAADKLPPSRRRDGESTAC